MAVVYATVPQFTAAYSVTGVTSAQLWDHWLPKASTKVSEMLAGHYSVPFSWTAGSGSPIATVRDLTVDVAYHGLRLRTVKPDDSDELGKAIAERFKMLTEGGRPLMTDSGDAIYPTAPGQNAWSSTQGYKPVFDMRDPRYQRVDPDRLSDEWSADRS